MNFKTLATCLAVSAIVGVAPGIVYAETPSMSPMPNPSAKPTGVKPSLDNGILCIARAAKGAGRISFTTSTIDHATLKSGGRPVSVTINEAPSTSMQVGAKPVAKAITNFTGKNTFMGKTETGKPLSFVLSADLSKATFSYTGMSVTGSCK